MLESLLLCCERTDEMTVCCSLSLQYRAWSGVLVMNPRGWLRVRVTVSFTGDGMDGVVSQDLVQSLREQPNLRTEAPNKVEMPFVPCNQHARYLCSGPFLAGSSSGISTWERFCITRLSLRLY